jgi:hypothetical protein
MSLAEVLRTVRRVHPKDLFGCPDFTPLTWTASGLYNYDIWQSDEWKNYERRIEEFKEAINDLHSKVREVMLPAALLEAVHEDFQDEVGMSFLYRMHEGQYYGDLVTPLIFQAFATEDARLDDKRILQIGGAGSGVKISQYLRAKGAHMTNLDLESGAGKGYCADDNFVHGDWREIDEIFRDQYFDVIFTEGMSPGLWSYCASRTEQTASVSIEEQKALLAATLDHLRPDGFLAINKSDDSCFQSDPEAELAVAPYTTLRLGWLSILGKPE